MDNKYPPDTDSQLLLQGLHDGHPATCRVVEGWLRRTVSLPQFRIPPDEIDDLVQESLAQILIVTGAPGFVVHTSLKALVRRVAMARSIDWIRRRRMMVSLAPDLAARFDDPLEGIARREQLGRVHEALGDLKALCRDLIRWHFIEEKTYKVISAETGRNANTLRVHMFNCLEALRTNLGM